MKTNLILIEGLPGSGKSTFANRLNEFLKENNIKTVMYQEGDLHPIDVSWCAILNEEEYNQTLVKYEKYADQIKAHTKKVDDDYIIAYIKIRVDKEDHHFYQEMDSKEIYTKTDLNNFKEYHMKLYNKFRNEFNKDTVYIFECVYLQNHINEHILKYDSSENDMNTYFTDLINQLKELHPTLVYLSQTDTEKTLTRMIEERVSPDKTLYKDWIDNVLDYFKKQPYSKKYGYDTKEGVYQYVKDRLEKEIKVIEKLPITSFIYPIDTNYDEVFEQLKNDILNTIKEG